MNDPGQLSEENQLKIIALAATLKAFGFGEQITGAVEELLIRAILEGKEKT